MAENVIEKAVIEVGWDSKKLQSGVSDIMNIVRGGMKMAVAGISGYEVYSKISQGMKQFTSELSELNKQTKNIEMSVENLEHWKDAAREFGAEGDNFSRVFTGVNDAMFQAVSRGRGVLKRLVDKGILPDFKDAEGKAKKTEDYVMEIADTMSQMDRRTAANTLKQISGITDIDSVEFLQQGTKAIKEQIEAVKNHTHFTTKDVKTAKELEKAQSKLSHAMKMTFLPVFRALVGPMTKFADLCTLAARHAEAFYPIIAGIAALLTAQMIPALAMAGKAAMGLLLSPWGALLAALLAIGVVLDDINGWINGDIAAFGDLYESIFGSRQAAYETFEEFKELLMGIAEGAEYLWGRINQVFGGDAIGVIGGVFKFVAQLIKDFIDGFTEMCSAVMKWWDELVEDVFGGSDEMWDSIHDFVQLVIVWFEMMIRQIKTLAKLYGTLLKPIIAGLIAMIGGIIKLFMRVFKVIADNKDAIMDIWETVTTNFEAACDAIGQAWEDISQGVMDAWGKAEKKVKDGIQAIKDKIQEILDMFGAIGDKIKEIGSDWINSRIGQMNLAGAGSGGNTTVNSGDVNNTIYVNGAMDEKTGDKVLDRLSTQGNNEGQTP